MCGSLRDARVLVCKHGPVKFGMAMGLGERVAPFWQMLNILSGFKTLAHTLYSRRPVLAQLIIKGSEGGGWR